MKFRIERVPYYVKVLLTLARKARIEGIKKYIWLGEHAIGLYFGKWTDLLEVKEVILDDEYKVASLSGKYTNIVDVGAGFGDFSIVMARKYPKAKIFAFDPDSPRFELLKKNIEFNKVKNVVPVKAAANSIKQISKLVTNQIDLIKFDCEGCEFEILLAASQEDLKNVKRIVMEYHLSPKRRLEKLVEKLETNGFVVETEPNSEVGNLGHLRAIRVNVSF